MAKKELSGRENWQTESGTKASNAEKNLYKAFEEHLKGIYFT